MQINNSINTNSNMLYHNEKKTKSLNSSFDLKTAYSSNETVNEERKIGKIDVQELYKVNASNNKLVGTKSMGNAIPARTDGLEVWCNGAKLEWSATDEKYTDEKTGISYYVGVRFSHTQQIVSSLFLSIFPCFITTNDFNMVKKSL